jgi:aspartyl/asparaginyl beta-hydroxylase (cupin superfamily)
MSFLGTFAERRRLAVKRTGRRFIMATASLVSKQSLVPDRPVHDSRQFPSLATIEANWRLIDSELNQLLLDRERLPPFHKISPDQKYISKGDSWKAFILFGFGVPSSRNCARCPETTRLLRTVPGLRSAWFSILAPRYHIPAHRGITKTVLRAHLGLKIPDRAEDCFMRVGEATVTWQPGECVVFDDFYRHEVWNNTDQERVVLIFDFDRPMRPLGKMINAFLMWGIKRTAYFRNAERNLKDWDAKLESAVMTADKLMEEKVDQA